MGIISNLIVGLLGGGAQAPSSKPKTLTKERKAYNDMKRRCYNPKVQRYPKYGGRGIKVCDHWLKSFDNFFTDLGPAPSPEYGINRIDVNGDYEPGNVEWDLIKNQTKNTTKSKRYQYKGKTMCEAEWARHLGIPRETLRDRVKRLGSFEKAISV